MRKEKVISNYKTLSDYELSTLAGRVLKAMQEATTQASFPNPNPDVTDLETIVNDYITKHEIASRRGSALEISLKNESRDALLFALKNLAHHVNEVADGQLSMLLSTGLVLASKPSSSEAPLVTTRIQLRDGRVSGQMRLDFTALKRVWEYEVEVGREDATNTVEWYRTFNTTSSRSNVLSDMVPGIKYYVRLRARNSKGYGDWSEAVSLIAR
ncbi:Fibronectin type III domain-containing protein [Sphingobacterium nematocida]|uniref:Fibronectin type III domain-containing protein n=1 Tax=Sphingobacterium nematocida TaxID=1513896 RepID=A0A1T5GR74_9SPHI|nr:fibronectin type III domain-containing protein [Sphingobacterium nematocida]SKC10869.1 Fibronectin type III domain-containing protein [Sphingobacterium nematocida]